MLLSRSEFCKASLYGLTNLVLPSTNLQQKPPIEPFFVRPYLVYPADKPEIPEFEKILPVALADIQRWYLEKVGATFRLAQLSKFRAKENYAPDQVSTNWVTAIKQIHNFPPGPSVFLARNNVDLLFMPGSGGEAIGGALSGNAGYARLGDWVLEGLSGKANDWGISCASNPHGRDWQCNPVSARGAIAHELAHAFGLNHPQGSGIENRLTNGQTNLDIATLSDNEIVTLRNSPLFASIRMRYNPNRDAWWLK